MEMYGRREAVPEAAILSQAGKRRPSLFLLYLISTYVVLYLRLSAGSIGVVIGVMAARLVVGKTIIRVSRQQLRIKHVNRDKD